MLAKLTALAAASLTIGTLALPAVASAHTATIQVSCQTGINVDLVNYHGTDHIKIRLDTVLIVDSDFHGEFHFHTPIGDQTKSHTWRVKVIAGDEASPYEYGTVKPCAETSNSTSTSVAPSTAPTTTVAPSATTTTTVALATDVPPVPSTTAPPCQEDQPCWNCATMGNGICGTTTTAPPTHPSSLPATGSRTGIELSIALSALAIGWCLLSIRRSRA